MMQRRAARLEHTTGPATGEVLSPTNRGVRGRTDGVVGGHRDGYMIARGHGNKGQLLWEKKIADAVPGQYVSMPTMISRIWYPTVRAAPIGGAEELDGAFQLPNGEQVWASSDYDGASRARRSGENPQAREQGGGSLVDPAVVDAEKGVSYVPVGNPVAGFYGRALLESCIRTRP